jgi:hypothetical protein
MSVIGHRGAKQSLAGGRIWQGIESIALAAECDQRFLQRPGGIGGVGGLALGQYAERVLVGASTYLAKLVRWPYGLYKVILKTTQLLREF